MHKIPDRQPDWFLSLFVQVTVTQTNHLTLTTSQDDSPHILSKWESQTAGSMSGEDQRQKLFPRQRRHGSQLSQRLLRR